MNYRVRWHETAVDDLTEMLRNADAALRRTIEHALHHIDSDLRHDPWALGESRAFGARIYFVAPVGVTFRVDRGGPHVIVEAVWHFRKRHPNQGA